MWKLQLSKKAERFLDKGSFSLEKVFKLSSEAVEIFKVKKLILISKN